MIAWIEAFADAKGPNIRAFYFSSIGTHSLLLVDSN